MSSHLFEELETTCDRVALINDGHIIDVANMDDIRNRPAKDMKIEFTNEADYDKFLKAGYDIIRLQERFVTAAGKWLQIRCLKRTENIPLTLRIWKERSETAKLG